MRTPLMFLALVLSLAIPYAAAGSTSEVVHYYSEAVRCEAKLFTPANHSASSNAPAVVVAPNERQTRASIEPLAAAIAQRGVVALAIDYRGWGGCGGFLYFAEPVRWDDRLRFMPMTTKMAIRRLRVDPKAQVIDIRNAMTFLQSVAGVDRGRIGVWGEGLAGGHAIVVAATDARVKAIVAQSPLLAGKDEPRTAFMPTREQQAAMVRLARTGAAPTNERAASTMNASEAVLALAEYKPYWYLDQIPETTAVSFVVAADDRKITDVEAAVRQLKVTATIAKLEPGRDAAVVAAEWFATGLR